MSSILQSLSKKFIEEPADFLPNKKISSISLTQSFIKDGDHGLSRSTDLEYIFFSIEQIIKKI